MHVHPVTRRRRRGDRRGGRGQRYTCFPAAAAIESAPKPACPPGSNASSTTPARSRPPCPRAGRVDTPQFNVGARRRRVPGDHCEPGTRRPRRADGCFEGWLLPMFEVVRQAVSRSLDAGPPATTPTPCRSIPSRSPASVATVVGCDMWMDEVLAERGQSARSTFGSTSIYAGPLGSEEPAMPVEDGQSAVRHHAPAHRMDRVAVPDTRRRRCLPPADASDPSSSIWPFGPFWNVAAAG